MHKWICWIRDQVRDFVGDGDLIRELQAEIRALSDGNAELRVHLAREEAEHEARRIEVENLRDDLRRAREQGESLVTVKKVWDALDRLEGDLRLAAEATRKAKRSIGEAFERGQLQRN